MNKKLLPILLSVLLMVALLFSSCAMDGADGKDGIDGKDGKDGITPTIEISEDGYWVINGEKTDVLAKGEQGDNASPVDENPQGLAFYLKDDGTYAVEIGYAKYLSRIEIPSTYKGKPVTEVGKFNDGTANVILKEIIIPDSVTSIGSSAFSDCVSLTGIEIPDSVTSMGDRAFSNCESLVSIVIPDNVTSIGEYAFSNCESLASIEIGDSVTSIGYRAFYGCESLASIEIGDNVTSIGEYAFYNCNSLVSIEIPDSVTSIGSDAFRYCSSLTKITLPFVGATKDGTENTHFGYIFGAGSYSYNGSEVPSSLKTVVVTGGTSIGYHAFANCRSLTSIVIPDSVTSIGEGAFYNCNSLVSIEIPDSVTSIGEGAFSDCYKLVEVINKSSLNITAGSTDYGYAACYAIEVHSGESKIVNQNDYLFYTYNGVNYLFGYVGSDTELVLPTSYNGANYEVYWFAFYYNNKITSVVIPDSVTSIGYRAFFGCESLASIEIGDSVTSIGDQAFFNCSSLVSIEIPDSVTSIGEGAFSGCYSLTSIVIPDSVTSIGSYAFRDCSSLVSIEIPDSVTSIGSYAFAYCDSLTIYCEAAWEPDGWSGGWNYSGCPVVWGYKG